MGLAAHPPERELKWSSNECRQRPWSASPCSAQPAPAHADTAETCVTRFYPAIAGEARGKTVEAVKIEMNIAKLIFGKTAEGRECEAVKPIRGKKAAAGAAMGRDGCGCCGSRRARNGSRRWRQIPRGGRRQNVRRVVRQPD